jgi:prepilin-type processing-associated H-X9-DG protein
MTGQSMLNRCVAMACAVLGAINMGFADGHASKWKLQDI